MRFRNMTILLTTLCACSGAADRSEEATASQSSAISALDVDAGSASCSASNIAWTVEATPGNTATATTTPVSDAICSGGTTYLTEQCTRVGKLMHCGQVTVNVPPNFSESPTGETLATAGLGVSAPCLSLENMPLLQPANPVQLSVPLITASNATGSATAPPFDQGLAQAKFAAIEAALSSAATGTYEPFTAVPAGYTVATYDSALYADLVGQAELLFELEGEYLTSAQQEAIWQLYLNNDARESCETTWTPAAPTGSLLCTSSIEAPSGNAEWGTYMQRALEACSALGSSHASVGAATQFASRCLALAAEIPEGIGTQVVTVSGGCSGHICPQVELEPEPCTYQPYRDEWRTMANALIQNVLQGVSAIPALQPTSLSAPLAGPDPSIQGELALIQQWYEGSRSLYATGALVATAQTGAAATISAIQGPRAVITGLTGMAPSNVNQYLTLSGASTDANNGTFQIQAVLSATSVIIANPVAIASDATNGALTWSVAGLPTTNFTQLWNDASMVVGAFWKAASQPALSTVASSNASAAQTFTTESLEAALQVFEAATSPTTSAKSPAWSSATGLPPLTTAPFLYLLGDLLGTVQSRLEYAGAFHDFGCRFRAGISAAGGSTGATGCVGVETPVAEMWQLLGAVASPTALSTALTTATGVGNWKTPFVALQQNHAAALEAATLDAFQKPTYASTLLTTGSATTLPAPALGLSQIVQAAGLHTASYAKKGILGVTSFTTTATGTVQAADSPNSLSVGLQGAFLGTNTGTTSAGQSTLTLLQRFKNLDTALSSAIVGYDQQEQIAVNSALGTNSSTSQAQDLQSEIQATQSQFSYQMSQIQGLEASAAAAAAAFGNLQSAYDTGVAKNGTVNPNAMNAVATFSTTVTPSSGRGVGFVGTTPNYNWSDIRAISTLHNGTWPAQAANGAASGALPGGAGTSATSPVQQGWMLNVNTSGLWSPTCALRQLSVMAPNPTISTSSGLTITGGTIVRQLDNTVEGAQTGPSGFFLTDTSGVLGVASGNTVTNGDTNTTFLGYCNSPGTCQGNNVQSANAGETSVSVNQGYSIDVSEGIRSILAPFTNAPVGALLLVEMTPQHYTPSDIIDVVVLQSPNTSVILNQAADVYLVDNDAANDGTATCTFSEPGELLVNVTELEPGAGLATSVMSAIKKAGSDIAAAAPGLVSQGTLLPDDMATLNAIAQTDLANALPQGTPIPAALTALFQAYVEFWLTDIERRVEIATLDQQVNLTYMQLTQYNQDLAANGTQSKYYSNIAAEALQNMNAYGTGLQSATTLLLQLMTQELYPAAAIRYPAALTAAQGLTTNLNALTTSLDWTSISTSQVTLAQQLADAIEENFESTVGTESSQETTGIPVALTFPNPAYTQPIGSAPSSYWTVADSVTSKAVWNAATTGSQVSLTITPGEIYGVGQAGTLGCQKVAPIIDNMVLYLGLGANDPTGPVITGDDVSFPIAFHDEQGFSTLSGLQMWDFNDPSWLNGANVYLLAGPATSALTALSSAVASNQGITYTAGAGLSPFSTIDLNFGGAKGFPVVLSQTSAVPTEIVLVMLVEATASGSTTLSWVPSCTETAAAATAAR